MRYLKLLIKLLLSCFLFWLIFKSVDFRSVLKNLYMVHIDLLIMGLATFSFQIIILAYRWAIVTGELGKRLTTSTAIRITFISQFFNQALPSSIGGDAVRVWLARKDGCELRQSVQSVIVDRAIATAILLIFILVGLPLQSAIFGSSLTIWIGDAIAVVLLSGFVFCLAIAVPFRQWLGRFRLVREVTEISLLTRRILVNCKYSLFILLLSVLNHALSIIGMILLALALDLSVVWTEYFVLVPFILLLSMIPISIGGWGLREGIMIAAFGYVGMSSESALSLSLLFGIVITIISLPGGVFWLLRRTQGMALVMIAEEDQEVI
jgi:uncharacterized protein (TIRG00374 family)